MTGTTKFTPYAVVPSVSASSTGASAGGGSASAGYMPCPPAAATASGSAGVAETLPIGASWIGRSLRSRSRSRGAIGPHYGGRGTDPLTCRSARRG